MTNSRVTLIDKKYIHKKIKEKNMWFSPRTCTVSTYTEAEIHGRTYIFVEVSGNNLESSQT